MSEFARVREELAANPSKTAQEHRCRYCGQTAAWETLSSYGARCGPCFAAYTREGFSERQRSSYAQKLLAQRGNPS